MGDIGTAAPAAPPAAEAKSFEITTPAPEPKAPEPITREQVRERGWSAKEMDSAEKRGLIQTPEQIATAKKEADEKAAAEKAEKPTPEPEKKVPPEELARRESDKEITEKDKEFLDNFPVGTPQRAVYLRMKQERQVKQFEKKLREEAEFRAEAAEKRLAELEKTKPVVMMDENGNAINPDDQPLTLGQWKAIQQKEKEQQDQAAAANYKHVQVVTEAHKVQESQMREEHADFDPTIELVPDLMNNLEAYVPERWKQAQVISLVRQLQVAAAQADKIDLDDNHAARLAYQIGQFHPKYGQRPETNPATPGAASESGAKNPTKGHGALTPEQMKRIEKNTQRGASSASVQGGSGKRVVSVDDVDVATLNGMSYKDRQKFRETYPDRYTEILRG